MNFRKEQFAALRKLYIGAGVVESFRGSKQTAYRNLDTDEIHIKNRRGNTTRLTFDDQGFIGNIISPLGRTWRLNNDQDGKLIGLSNPAGLHLGIKYHAGGEAAVISRDSEKLFSLSYNDQRCLSEVSYPDRTSTRIDYDSPDRISTVTNRLGFSESYDYDFDGDLIGIADGNDNRTIFQYGDWHSPASVHYADGSSEAYQYDPSGMVRQIAVGSELIATIDYDERGNPITIAYEDGDVL